MDVCQDPRAGQVDGDGLRIWQACGLSAPALEHVLSLPVVLSAGPPDWRSLHTVAPSRSPHGYWRANFFFQPFIESQLRAALARAGVPLLGGLALERIDATREPGEPVAAHLRCLASGPGSACCARALDCRGGRGRLGRARTGRFAPGGALVDRRSLARV